MSYIEDRDSYVRNLLARIHSKKKAGYHGSVASHSLKETMSQLVCEEIKKKGYHNAYVRSVDNMIDRNSSWRYIVVVYI